MQAKINYRRGERPLRRGERRSPKLKSLRWGERTLVRANGCSHLQRRNQLFTRIIFSGFGFRPCVYANAICLGGGHLSFLEYINICMKYESFSCVPPSVRWRVDTCVNFDVVGIIVS